MIYLKFNKKDPERKKEQVTASYVTERRAGRVHVVVVYYVTIVAIGYWLLKKFWPFGIRLRSTHMYIKDLYFVCALVEMKLYYA